MSFDGLPPDQPALGNETNPWGSMGCTSQLGRLKVIRSSYIAHRIVVYDYSPLRFLVPHPQATAFTDGIFYRDHPSYPALR